MASRRATVTKDQRLDEDVRAGLASRRQQLEQATARPGASDDLRSLLAEVDAALGRLETGTFGLCEVCHEPIEHDRLVADPLARACVDHVTAHERQALAQDLELAGQIQMRLLPHRQLAVAGWQVAYHFEPAGKVGGDYCDVILAEDGAEALMLLGDVAGKGVAASILMSNLHATFRSLANSGRPVGALMSRANRLFCQSTLDSHYATLVCARTTSTGCVEIVNAGHWPVLVARRHGVEAVGATGVPLGLFCASEYHETTVTLAQGDLLLLHTDGLSEARGPSGEEYGQLRLTARLAALAADGERDPHRVIAECLDDLAAFRAGTPLDDDLTLMVVGRSG